MALWGDRGCPRSVAGAVGREGPGIAGGAERVRPTITCRLSQQGPAGSGRSRRHRPGRAPGVRDEPRDRGGRPARSGVRRRGRRRADTGRCRGADWWGGMRKGLVRRGWGDQAGGGGRLVGSGGFVG